jgi:hypothetical protein
LNRMRLTFARRRRANAASWRACSGRSFTWRIRMYSSVISRPVRSKYSSQASSSSSIEA